MQVRPDDQPGCPKGTIESFLGHSSMGLLCPRALPKKGKILKNKFYVSSDGSHTVGQWFVEIVKDVTVVA